MEEIFTHDIAVPFAQMRHAQAVETGYLSTNTLPIVASPPRAQDAVRVLLLLQTPSRAASPPRIQDTAPS